MMNGSDIQVKCAQLYDIDEVLKLHYRYQIDSIAEEDKADGFVTTAFTQQQMSDLIEQENGLFIALKDSIIVAYAMSASWHFWSSWPMFAYMIQQLPSLSYQGQALGIDNSYQYGPICIDKSVRGTGVLEKLFAFAKNEMSRRYEILITFVNKNNGRSYQAHSRKLGLDVLQEFEFNKNYYYEMACLTK